MTRPGLPVVFTLRAAREVEQAFAWWAENSANESNVVRQELALAIELIALQPALGKRAMSARLDGVRRVLLSRIDYFLYYRVRPRLRRIDVVAFWHAKRGTQPGL